ncbi:hypothetical protein J4421_03620 [Candidatus Woesearchaeota archaeon]|nr:hypothetical protein [Candidatus Woesearchaeota archaeon]
MILKLFFLFLFLLPIVQAQVAIESFTTTPHSVAPGEETVLTLEIENVGNKRINNILVALDLTALPLATVDSSTEKIMEKIRSDDRQIVSFRIRVLPTAKPQVYKIPVTLTYEGVSKTSLLSLEVSALAKLEIVLDNSNLLTVGDKGKINLRFVNNGLIPITFLTATMQESEGYEIIGSKSVYVGDVDVADFETEEFMLLPKIKDTLVQVDLLYHDANNQEYSTTKFVPLKVYTKDEAQRLGLVASNSGGWVVASVIIIALLIFYIFRKIRKKRKNDS